MFENFKKIVLSFDAHKTKKITVNDELYIKTHEYRQKQY